MEIRHADRIWFAEGTDFNPLKKERVRFEGNRQVTRQIDDAIMTLDIAKEIAMIQRYDNGKQAMEYFIACENSRLPQQKLSVALLLKIIKNICQ